MTNSHQHVIYLSAAEREAGTFVELHIDDDKVLVEVPAGAQAGSQLKVRHGQQLLRVRIQDRQWGVAGDTSLNQAPRDGELSGDAAFWQRAEEELVESYRSDKSLAGAVYVERHDEVMVLSGLTRRAVAAHQDLRLDATWGALLWVASPGVMAGLNAFSEQQKKEAKRLGRPIVHIGHSALSPKSAATLVFPVGMRSLALFAGLNGLLAIDERRRGETMLLGRALAARIIYPSGRVFAVGHSGASLPRELYDMAAFRVDQKLGHAKKRASRAFKDFIRTAVQGPQTK